jgi:hypothetical protein
MRKSLECALLKRSLLEREGRCSGKIITRAVAARCIWGLLGNLVNWISRKISLSLKMLMYRNKRRRLSLAHETAAESSEMSMRCWMPRPGICILTRGRPPTWQRVLSAKTLIKCAAAQIYARPFIIHVRTWELFSMQMIFSWHTTDLLTT